MKWPHFSPLNSSFWFSTYGNVFLKILLWCNFLYFSIIIHSLCNSAINISHDEKAITVNYQCRVLIFGSIHHLQSTRQMWLDLIKKKRKWIKCHWNLSVLKSSMNLFIINMILVIILNGTLALSHFQYHIVVSTVSILQFLSSSSIKQSKNRHQYNFSNNFEWNTCLKSISVSSHFQYHTVLFIVRILQFLCFSSIKQSKECKSCHCMHIWLNLLVFEFHGLCKKGCSFKTISNAFFLPKIYLNIFYN